MLRRLGTTLAEQKPKESDVKKYLRTQAIRKNVESRLVGTVRWIVKKHPKEEPTKFDTRKLVVRPMTHADKKAVLEIDRAVSGKERTGYLEAKFFRVTEDKEQLLNSLVVEYEAGLWASSWVRFISANLAFPMIPRPSIPLAYIRVFSGAALLTCCLMKIRAMLARRV
jgi:hypothetical protein